MDARQRIASLLQGGSFTEVGQLAGGEVDAFIAGIGSLNGRPVAVGCEDFTVKGGSIGRAESAKRYRIAELALQERIPLIMLLEGAGHRPPLPDDPPSFRTPGDLQAQADASGRIPLATAVLGPSAGTMSQDRAFAEGGAGGPRRIFDLEKRKDISGKSSGTRSL